MVTVQKRYNLYEQHSVVKRGLKRLIINPAGSVNSRQAQGMADNGQNGYLGDYTENKHWTCRIFHPRVPGVRWLGPSGCSLINI